MASLLHHPQVKRARPLLGTLVAIRLQGLPVAEAHRAIGCGFAQISKIHSLMSSHERSSDVSQLNRTAHRKPVAVHSHTFEVLRRAISLASDSKGVFDPSIGGQLVDWGHLPAPDFSKAPDPKASWRDIELMSGDRVRFHRRLWIDLGGIAKGYAVDRGIAAIGHHSEVQCCVNAGGDLRVRGPAAERVRLKVQPAGNTIPVLEIKNGSVASSSGYGLGRRREGRAAGPHLHGVRRRAVGARSFVTVLAEDCIIADALTKIVLAKGPRADAFLRRQGAAAYLHNARDGWRLLGAQS